MSEPEDVESVTVRMEHMRRLRYCSRGVREFFERHALDYNSFLDRGIPAEALEATGDAMALDVVEVARG